MTDRRLNGEVWNGCCSSPCLSSEVFRADSHLLKGRKPSSCSLVMFSVNCTGTGWGKSSRKKDAGSAFELATESRTECVEESITQVTVLGSLECRRKTRLV